MIVHSYTVQSTSGQGEAITFNRVEKDGHVWQHQGRVCQTKEDPLFNLAVKALGVVTPLSMRRDITSCLVMDDVPEMRGRIQAKLLAEKGVRSFSQLTPRQEAQIVSIAQALTSAQPSRPRASLHPDLRHPIADCIKTMTPTGPMFTMVRRPAAGADPS